MPSWFIVVSCWWKSYDFAVFPEIEIFYLEVKITDFKEHLTVLIVKTESLKWATWQHRLISCDLNFRIFFLKHEDLFIARETKVGLRSIIHNPIKSWPAALVLYAYPCRHLSCAVNTFRKHVIFLHAGSTYFFNGIDFRSNGRILWADFILLRDFLIVSMIELKLKSLI